MSPLWPPSATAAAVFLEVPGRQSGGLALRGLAPPPGLSWLRLKPS